MDGGRKNRRRRTVFLSAGLAVFRKVAGFRMIRIKNRKNEGKPAVQPSVTRVPMAFDAGFSPLPKAARQGEDAPGVSPFPFPCYAGHPGWPLFPAGRKRAMPCLCARGQEPVSR